jgi:CheY-like chemotaxis protein
MGNHAYLASHPLMARLEAVTPADGPLRVEQLRALLSQLVASLRPQESIPSADPSWRPYRVIQRRFGDGLGASEVGDDLGLSVRQVQREQRRGLQAMARSLVAMLEDASESSAAGPADALASEIERVSDDSVVYDAREPTQAGVQAVRPLLDRSGTQLELDLASLPMLVSGSPVVHKQLVIAAASYALRCAGARRLRLGLARSARYVVLSLVAVQTRPSQDTVAEAPPSELVALVEHLCASIDVGEQGTTWYMHVRLPAVGSEPVVALVDDNQDLASLFGRYLTGHGYRLMVVPSADRALEQLAHDPADVIVLDIMMRGTDGWELLRQLKAAEDTARIPVVICSVLNQPELAETMGAVAYLCKPVTRRQLLDCLAEVLQAHNGPSAPR